MDAKGRPTTECNSAGHATNAHDQENTEVRVSLDLRAGPPELVERALDTCLEECSASLEPSD